MKQRLEPGAELDFVTTDELDARLKALRRHQEDPRIFRAAESGATDANGNGEIAIYSVPAGLEVEVGFVIVELEGATPGVPVTSAAGFLDLLRNGQRVDFKGKTDDSTRGLVFPAKFDYSGHNTRRYRNGDTIGVRITNGPTGKTFFVTVDGYSIRAESPVTAESLV